MKEKTIRAFSLEWWEFYLGRAVDMYHLTKTFGFDNLEKWERMVEFIQQRIKQKKNGER